MHMGSYLIRTVPLDKEISYRTPELHITTHTHIYTIEGIITSTMRINITTRLSTGLHKHHGKKYTIIVSEVLYYAPHKS